LFSYPSGSKTGYWQLLFFPGDLLTMALQLYAISKNDAKKNPAEFIQRDVEKKNYFTAFLSTSAASFTMY